MSGFGCRWRRLLTLLAALGLALATTTLAHAMHIAEGFLPPQWSAFWFVVAAPFVVIGYRRLRHQIGDDPQRKLTLGMSGAFAFVLSSLKIPSVTGSCSHPTGVALGAILFGPFPMAVIGLIILLFQAILLAHGGLTTLGANAFSMAVAGPFVSYAVFQALRRLHPSAAVFLAATLGDWATYIVTAIQLALAFPGPVGGVVESFAKFVGIFAVTQVPLALSEGLLTLVVFNLLLQYHPEVLASRGVIPGTAGTSASAGLAETSKEAMR
jgi:cobalt/nickel transport system permease protein